jgi:hypothetical protein
MTILSTQERKYAVAGNAKLKLPIVRIREDAKKSNHLLMSM